jgi:hypothetical protein
VTVDSRPSPTASARAPEPKAVESQPPVAVKRGETPAERPAAEASRMARAVEPARASAAVPDRPDAPVTPSVREVSVQKGDTLGALVLRAYGRADVTLLDHVKMANPTVDDINVIEVGKRLRFPPLDASRMVHRQGNAQYVLHLATVARLDSRVLEKLRAAVAEQGHKLYVVPIRFTDDFEVYRVLVGDFDDQAQAEKFSRAVPPSLRPVDLALGVTR